MKFCLSLQGYEDIVALLLRAGAPVDCRVTEDSSTPLHKACAGSKAGHLAAVKLLLEGDADVHSLNKWRETPLLTAANHGQSGAVDALLRAGADPCKCTDTGWSPLSIAAYKGHDEVVRLLLEEGAPTEEDDPTLSALLQAATKGLPGTVNLLLLHGADHTVTTKKGDTALSILVEQNLIDAAVDMVAEYNASIPRCSRDRKKVQRARLLINLRMKQLQREGKSVMVTTDDDDETDDESQESKLVALHDKTTEGSLEVLPSGKKKKKGKTSAEQKAKAAEEALLLELEKEDEDTKKEEAKANSKQAKKKKKKERERQLKVQEDQERREREESETKERDRLKMEQEAKEREERHMKLRAQRERELKEMAVREKVLATKRKEREERESLIREQQERTAADMPSTVSPLESSALDKHEKDLAAKKAVLTGAAPGAANKHAAPTPAVDPLAGNRRWETKVQPRPNASDVPTKQSDEISSLLENGSGTDSVSPAFLSPQPEAPPTNSHSTSRSSVSPSFVASSTVEHPAIALFRREKVSELIQRCSHALDVVDEPTIKRAIYHWVVRAAHGQARYADPIIPSWEDSDQLVAFFQRQFISESRRRAIASANEMASMEALKEAGSSVAALCQNLVKEVSQLRERIEAQLPSDWTDALLGMAAADGTHDGNGSIIIVSWANRSQVYVPTVTFAALRDRYSGPPSRFLASVFVAKVLYETNRMVATNTEMDFRLSPDTQACLSTEAAVSAELWTDPFSAWNGNVFWGKFDGIDSVFGGQKPFGKDEHGGEEVLARHGGSIAVVVPFDGMVAAHYIQRIVDILDGANSTNVAVSFAVFLRRDCFNDLPSGPSVSDLHLLDSRLADQQQAYVRHIEVLPAGQHKFHCGDGLGASKVDSTDSLFVLLQSVAGRSRFGISNASVARIVGSMLLSPREGKRIAPSFGFTSDYSDMQSPLSPHSGYFEGLAPTPQESHQGVRSDFGAIGGTGYSQPFSTHDTSSSSRRGPPRRGRLFDLVDDVEEDHLSDVDVVSGMLNSLDVGLFQNGSVAPDVDIEAISLMGIDGPHSTSLPPSRHSHSRQ